MSPVSFLRQLCPRKHGGQRPIRRCVRPAVELLETRTAPASLVGLVEAGSAQYSVTERYWGHDSSHDSSTSTFNEYIGFVGSVVVEAGTGKYSFGGPHNYQLAARAELAGGGDIEDDYARGSANASASATVRIDPDPGDEAGDLVRLQRTHYKDTWGNIGTTFYGGTSLPGTSTAIVPIGTSFELSVSAAVSINGNWQAGHREKSLEYHDLTISPLLSGLLAESMTWTSGSLGVWFTYAVEGDPTPRPTGAELYWASGPSLADRLDGPVYLVPIGTGTEPGSYPHTVPGTALAPRPADATHLLLVVDPLGRIGLPSVAALALPDLAAQSLWPESDGFEFGYSANNLPADTTVALYWAAGESFASRIGGPAYSAPAERHGTYYLSVSAAQLGSRPAGATHLLLVTDPGGAIEEQSEVNNVLATLLPPPPPGPPVPVLTNFDVQHGQTQRSFVRYLDLAFADGADLNELLGGGRVSLKRFALDGSGAGATVNLAGVLSVTGNMLSFDFGAQGIGGSRNSAAGDGYYVLDLDLDGDGTFETHRRFYRLFGDANGDHKVSMEDAWAIAAAFGTANAERDVNGDGIVNSLDRTCALRNIGHALLDALPLDD